VPPQGQTRQVPARYAVRSEQVLKGSALPSLPDWSRSGRLTADRRLATIQPRGRAVISDIDIWRSANELIKRYGDTADIEASIRADALLNKGDLEGQRIWLRILKAIDALRCDRPCGSTQ
jgi:hypothetical protein